MDGILLAKSISNIPIAPFCIFAFKVTFQILLPRNFLVVFIFVFFICLRPYVCLVLCLFRLLFFIARLVVPIYLLLASHGANMWNCWDIILHLQVNFIEISAKKRKDRPIPSFLCYFVDFFPFSVSFQCLRLSKFMYCFVSVCILFTSE